MIRRFVTAAAAAAALASCTSKSSVEVTSGSAVETRARSEPIFYNGQHYKVNYTYNATLRLFDMKVAGSSVTMTGKDAKTATAIATSALRHFACPDSQSGRLIGQPKFSSPVWSMQAKCA